MMFLANIIRLWPTAIPPKSKPPDQAASPKIRHGSNFLAPVVSLSSTAADPSSLGFLIVAAIGRLMLSAWFAALFMERFRAEVPGLSLIRTRRVYADAMRRFWLDDFYQKTVVAGAVRPGQPLDRFDTGTIDRPVGAPVTAGRANSASSPWEQRYLAARAAGISGPWAMP